MAFTRQVAKIGMISTLEKRSGNFKIYRKTLAKQELTKSSAIADHIKATGHNLKWGILKFSRPETLITTARNLAHT